MRRVGYWPASGHRVETPLERTGDPCIRFLPLGGYRESDSSTPNEGVFTTWTRVTWVSD